MAIHWYLAMPKNAPAKQVGADIIARMCSPQNVVDRFVRGTRLPFHSDFFDGYLPVSGRDGSAYKDAFGKARSFASFSCYPHIAGLLATSLRAAVADAKPELDANGKLRDGGGPKDKARAEIKQVLRSIRKRIWFVKPAGSTSGFECQFPGECPLEPQPQASPEAKEQDRREAEHHGEQKPGTAKEAK